MSKVSKNNPPSEKRCRTQPFVVVGSIVVNDNKFLLVQEGQGTEKGLWNQPAGWLDMGEHVIDGALRETKEETGLELEMVGFLGIYNLMKPRKGEMNHAIKLIFAIKALSDQPKFDTNEILDAKWFTLEEVEALGDKLRDPDIPQAIRDYIAGKIIPLDNLETYTNVFDSIDSKIK